MNILLVVLMMFNYQDVDTVLRPRFVQIENDFTGDVSFSNCYDLTIQIDSNKFIVNNKKVVEWEFSGQSSSEKGEIIKVFTDKYSSDYYMVYYVNKSIIKFVWYNDDEKLNILFIEDKKTI